MIRDLHKKPFSRRFPYIGKTRNIQIEVLPEYCDERSNPEADYYFFLYTVRICNQGQETFQLKSRHWIITNASGHVEEVIGEGVVGEQPVLSPGESFEYTSACPLNTATGNMRGTYQMTSLGGESFNVNIPEFHLQGPPEFLVVH